MGFLSSLGTFAGSLFGGPAGGAVGGLIGSGLEGNSASSSASQANDASIQQAEANRGFQEQMSNTAYQRAVKDMQAAGLNPMLAYSQGGASTPGGAQAQIQNAGLASAQQAQAYASADAASSQADLNVASAGESRARTVVAQKTVDKVVQETYNAQSEEARIAAGTSVLNAEFNKLVAETNNLDEIKKQIQAIVVNLNADTRVKNADVILKGAIEKFTSQQTVSEKSRSALLGQDERAGAAFGEVGKTAGALRPFLELLWNAVRR